jgi:SAM-dependent methyltransferase
VSEASLAAAELLWGEGFLVPGGPEHILDLVRPLHLGAGGLLVDVAAGLGGPARVIARRTGAWVTGLERSPDAAARGMALSTSVGLAREAAIRPYNPDALELERHAFDAAFARFASWELAERERFLRCVIDGLARGGRMLLVDLVAGGEGGEAFQSWRDAAGLPPPLWTADQYTDCLAAAGMEVHFTLDVTPTHRALLREGWRRLAARLDGLDAETLAAVADVTRLWQTQAAALDAGALGVTCVCASRG